MANEIVNKGTAVELGFNSYTYSMLILDDVNLKPTGDITEIRDDNDNVQTMLLSNLGTRMTLRGTIKAAATELATLVALKRGDAVTVNLVAYFVDDCDINLRRGAADCTLVLQKYAAMTHS